MKIIKGFLKFIINSIIICAIGMLAFSITGKQVFYDLLYSNVFKPVITEQTKTITKTNDNATNEQLEKLMESKEMQELVNKYIEQTMQDLSSDDPEVTANIINDFLDFLLENKEMLQKEYGITITEEQIQELKQSPEYQQITESYQESITTTKKNMSKEEKQAIKTYNLLVSNKFRYILIGIIVVCIILLMLINKSLYSWLKDFSVDLITSGVMILAASLIVQAIVDAAIKTMDITFSTKPLTNTGIIITVSGIVLLIIYIIIKKIATKKPDIDEEKPVTAS